MIEIIIVVLVVFVVIWFLNSSDDEDKGNSNMSICDRVKKGNMNLGTKDPIFDYIKARQFYNFNEDITEDDLIDIGIIDK
jgi:hypothetical protein